MSGIFTKIILGEIPSYKVAENDDFIAFLDVNPIVKGHTLVVPKKEIDYIFEMEDGQLQEFHLFAKKVAKAIKSAIPCKKVGVAVIGLEVPHAHIHLVPLNQLSDMSFTAERKTFSPEEYSQIAKDISLNF